MNNARFALDEFPETGFYRERLKLVASGISMPYGEAEGYVGISWPYLSQTITDEFGLC